MAGGIDETEVNALDVYDIFYDVARGSVNIAHMALSSFNRALSRVDLPALVSPMIATGIPFLRAFPNLKEWSDG